MAKHAQNKLSWICGTPEEALLWKAVRGLEPTGSFAFFPSVSFPLKDLGLWKVFCISESFPCCVGKGKSLKRAGFFSCSLLLNSIFLSVFDCVFLPHLLLLYMICQYWVSSHYTLLSLNVYSSSPMVPPFTTAFSSGLV